MRNILRKKTEDENVFKVNLNNEVRNIIPQVKIGDLVKVTLKTGESVTRSVLYKGYTEIALSDYNPFRELKKDWKTARWEDIDCIEIIDRNINQRHPDIARPWITRRDEMYPFRWTRISGQLTDRTELFELIRINEVVGNTVHSRIGYIVGLGATAVFLHQDDPLDGLDPRKIKKYPYSNLTAEWTSLRISPLLDILFLQRLNAQDPNSEVTNSQESFTPAGTHEVPKYTKKKD